MTTAKPSPKRRGRVLCITCLASELGRLPSLPGSSLTIKTTSALDKCSRCGKFEDVPRRYHVTSSHASPAETLVENVLGGSRIDSETCPY